MQRERFQVRRTERPQYENTAKHHIGWDINTHIPSVTCEPYTFPSWFVFYNPLQVDVCSTADTNISGFLIALIKYCHYLCPCYSFGNVLLRIDYAELKLWFKSHNFGVTVYFLLLKQAKWRNTINIHKFLKLYVVCGKDKTTL